MPRSRSPRIAHVFADGHLVFLDRQLPCSLGSGGIVQQKQEGDGGTPAGLFPVRDLWRRTDKVCLSTSIPSRPIHDHHGWCDDPASAVYNRSVRRPFGMGHERLHRQDDLYDLVLTIGHNDRPARPGSGSAIFVHVRPPDHGPTAGCIAPAKDDLIWLLTVLRPGDMIKVHAPDRKTPRFPPRRVLP